MRFLHLRIIRISRISQEYLQSLALFFLMKSCGSVNFEGLWSAPQNRKVLSRTPDEKFLRHRAGETVDEYTTVIQPSRWNTPGAEV